MSQARTLGPLGVQNERTPEVTCVTHPKMAVKLRQLHKMFLSFFIRNPVADLCRELVGKLWALWPGRPAPELVF